MLTLAQMALLAMVRSGKKYDLENPVILDQMFQIKKTMQKNKIHMGYIKEQNSYIKEHESYRDIKLDMVLYDKLTDHLSRELFDYTDINSDSIEEVIWKEYFFHLYELLIISYVDHPNTLVLINNIVACHDVLTVPTVKLPETLGPVYRLFERIKEAQKKMVPQNMNVLMNASLNTRTLNNLNIFRRKEKMKQLKHENNLLNEILEYVN